MLWWAKIIEGILAVWNSANRVAEKALPSEKIQEGKFEIEKETLEVKQDAKQAEARNKIIDEMFHDLKRHMELSVEDKVNFELRGWSEEEKRLAIKIISERRDKYQEKKNKPKKSKFRL